MKDKFAVLAGIVIVVTVAINLFSCYINESNKTYSEIPDHEKEIVQMIRADDYHSCFICDKDYFDFELLKLGEKYYCHDCLNEYFEIIYYEDMP